jgi:hypothetical protein
LGKTDDGGPPVRLVVAKKFQFDLSRNDGNFVTADALGHVRFVLKQFGANVGRYGVWQYCVIGARV